MVQNLIDIEILNTRKHKIFKVNIALKLKGNVLRMAFLAVCTLQEWTVLIFQKNALSSYTGWQIIL